MVLLVLPAIEIEGCLANPLTSYLHSYKPVFSGYRTAIDS